MWWKSFELAERKSWEALIPVYNYYVAFKIGCKKPFWSLLLIFPGVHLVMWSVANVSYIRRFGYYSLIDTVQGVFFPYIVMAKIATSGDKALPETNWANSKEVSEREWGDHLVLFLTVPVLGHIVALGLAAVTRAQPGKKTKVKEWGDSLLFALVAASIIRTYVFEPFQIPTGSMEKTLLVGDFLFVNKLAYGPKVPVTPLSYPLVHNTIPWINVKSYTALEKGEYTRLPGFSEVKRNDVVVFNYPSGDTAVYDPRMPDGLMGHDYHGILITEALRQYKDLSPDYSQNYQSAMDKMGANIIKRQKTDPSYTIPKDSMEFLAVNYAYEQFLANIDKWKARTRKYLGEDKKAFTRLYDNKGYPYNGEIDHYGLIYRPVDKRENYIKRCVGTPGDFIEIKKSMLYVNDKMVKPFPFQNLQYRVYLANVDVNFMNEIGMEQERDDYYAAKFDQTTSGYVMNLTQEQLARLKARYPSTKIELVLEPQYSDDPEYTPNSIELYQNLLKFPKDPYVNNTITDFTRFQIPFKGQKIEINKENIAWYRRIITAYEGHTLVEKGSDIYIDGVKATTYTFAMNYYWLMGDNRYNSADSRIWGFVPEDHIVGKASMVWFSKSAYAGIRWERLFTIIK